jgi:hypothetical protein
MKFNNSNKRDHLIIAGILILVIAAIFLAIALGIVGKMSISTKFIQDQGNQNLWFLNNNNSDEELRNADLPKTGRDDVLVDQHIDDPDHHYVEMGTIDLVDDSFDDDFPICVTPNWGDDQWVVIRVKGGYEPALQNYPGYGDYYGMFTITDKNHNIIMNPCQGMYVGWFLSDYDSWTCTGDSFCDHCYVYYNFTLDPHACENWICLDSSYDLDGNLCEDKYVLVEYDTHWKGCNFDYILAHENHVLRIPNSRFNIYNYIAS